AASAGRELDLSCWEVAWNGAEPIRAETLRRFTESFAVHGFRPSAWLPCYGLAECTVMVTGQNVPDGARRLTVRTHRLSRGEVEACERGFSGGVELVGGGPAADGTEVRIVDPDKGNEAAPGRVGEIWVSSPSVALGYAGRPDESLAIFKARLGSAGVSTFL